MLIVEDDEDQRRYVRQLLTMAGIAAIATPSVGSAMAYADFPDVRVDVVLTDLHIDHGGDGIDLLRKWQSKRSDTVFVIMTADHSAQPAVEAMKAGAHDYLLKPVAPETLMESVAKALTRAKIERSIGPFPVI